jgi:predicted nucleic acid-binding protein
VFRECVAAGKHSADLLKVYLREKVVEVDLAAFAIAAVDLGRGELEAIALCKRIAADRLLVDDRRARQIAVLNDIEVVGSLGVLLAAKRNGLLNDIESRIETMRSAGIRLGPGLVAEALRLAGEPK